MIEPNLKGGENGFTYSEENASDSEMKLEENNRKPVMRCHTLPEAIEDGVSLAELQVICPQRWDCQTPVIL